MPKMNAAVVRSFDQPPHYQQSEVPQPTASQQPLVDVLAVGLHPRVRSAAAGVHYTSNAGTIAIRVAKVLGTGVWGKPAPQAIMLARSRSWQTRNRCRTSRRSGPAQIDQANAPCSFLERTRRCQVPFDPRSGPKGCVSM